MAAFLLALCALVLGGCANITVNTKPAAVDYSDKGNWAYFGEGDEKAADLFLIAPTVDVKDEYNMSMDDEPTKANFLGALNMERGIYEDSTRMFAPYYRQGAMKIYSMTPEEREPYLAAAYDDIKGSFEYYLENENHDRPIVLAGFSQGADMCYRLLEDYFGDEKKQDKLVAVYAIGWPCTEEMAEKYPQIKPAVSETDTGVVISFDCEAPDVTDTFITPKGTKAYTINPLNWKTDETPADRSLNAGACFTDYDGNITNEVKGLCGCYIDEDRGIIKVPDVAPVDFPAIVPGLPEGAYHIYDYQFFYRNLQENVAKRIDVFTNSGTDEPDTEDTTEIDKILDGMTLRDKVEQMMIVSFRVWKEVPDETENDISKSVENSEKEIPSTNITELNDDIRSAITSHHFGGTTLFAENYKNAEQTVRLVADIQQTNLEGGGIPMIVATDQEGGNVARIGFGTSGVGNMALAATGDPENAKSMATIYGEELSLLGVNTDFAPVTDVNNNPNNPVIGVRSFSDSPDVVTEYGLKYMEGLHDTGTIATLKHFPGHGNTDTDSHTGFPCIQSSLDELKQFELVPIQKAIDAGVDMVMTAHIQYPQIEKNTYTSISTGEEVYLPATMSDRILTGVLREDLGFEGVIVSDALDMAAISENFSTEDQLILTINSGVNMLILPLITDTAIFRKDLDMADMAVKLAEEGKIDTARIDDSVRRILTLKQKYGLLDKKDFTVTDEQIKAAEEGVGSKAHRETEWDLANKALTLVKNEDNAFPISLEDDQTVLILFADSCASRIGTGELVKQMLIDRGVVSDDEQISVMVNDADNEKECLKAAEEAGHCILVYRTYGTSNLDPDNKDGFSSAVFDDIIEERKDEDKRSILVSCQLPYDAARFQEADAILLSYNSAAMSDVPPESGEGSAYAPNLAAALAACFGDKEISGHLPVNIPKLDDDYEISDVILYKRDYR